MIREAKNDVIVYYPPPNVCVDVNALHFHITGVSLWAIMKSINQIYAERSFTYFYGYLGVLLLEALSIRVNAL